MPLQHDVWLTTMKIMSKKSATRNERELADLVTDILRVTDDPKVWQMLATRTRKAAWQLNSTT